MGPKKRGRRTAAKKAEETTDASRKAAVRQKKEIVSTKRIKKQETQQDGSSKPGTSDEDIKLEKSKEPSGVALGGYGQQTEKAEAEKKVTMSRKQNMKKKMRKQAKKVEREKLAMKLRGQHGLEPAQDDIIVEYVPPPSDIILGDLKESMGVEIGNEDTMHDFSKILERFGGIDQMENEEMVAEGLHDAKGPTDIDEKVEPSDTPEDGEQRISKRKLKELNRMKIGELKQACPLPEVVEVWDATSAEPLMLVHLKAYRNTVPVPRHWSQKRKYLQGKRGLEKPPFKLPSFIAATGIGEMRQAYNDKAEAQNLKSKGRERTQPKMGKLDIDYRILYDAFFKHQKKPPLTRAGDLYYEGKEFELGTEKHLKPGVMSDALLEALGIDRGAPPPWLIAMQRYGPPPSYPSLRIPGLNAPIPHGAQFGYHPGGWGKPPVDEHGNPIYGDVFGEDMVADDDEMTHATVHWGEIEEVSESDEDESEEEQSGASDDSSEEEQEVVETKEEPDSYPATISGLDTPAEVQIRKGIETPDVHSKSLYHVLEEKKSSARDAGIMGSERLYSMPGGSNAAAKRLEMLKKGMPDDLEVSIDPSDLESLDDEALRELYEGKVAAQRAGRDFSDLVAQRAASDKKRKASEKTTSKEKKFKF